MKCKLSQSRHEHHLLDGGQQHGAFKVCRLAQLLCIVPSLCVYRYLPVGCRQDLLELTRNILKPSGSCKIIFPAKMQSNYY